MKTKTRQPLLAAIALCLGAAASPASAASADGDGWNWVIAPYGWFTTIGADLETGIPPSNDPAGDTAFEDIVDKLDGAFQVHVEGQGEQFGMFADFTFLGLADEKDRPRFSTEADLDTRLFELAGVWSPGDERNQGLELFAGLRHVDVDLTVDVDPVNPAFVGGTIRADQSFDDVMVGARYGFKLSERWGLTLRADGSFGDTDGTWNASAVAQYRTSNGMWLLGYRHMTINLEPGDDDVAITMSGPLVGYGFAF